MFKISHLPERTVRPRNNGLTMVMDKGLSLRGAEDLIETGGELVDLLKLGFGTSLVTPGVEKKVKLYR
ncbi:MAG: phosphosulfolactate synthase, partial [Flavobacteriales bacterium]